MGKKKREAKGKREAWKKHGYTQQRTRHGVASVRLGKTDRKARQRAGRAVVRGKYRQADPEAPSSREQARKRPTEPVKPVKPVITTAPTVTITPPFEVVVFEVDTDAAPAPAAPPPPAPPPPPAAPAAGAKAVEVDEKGHIKKAAVPTTQGGA